MNSLQLNEEGLQLARNHFRCSEYLSLLQNMCGFSFSKEDDRYVLVELVQNEILQHICSQLGIDYSLEQPQPCFKPFQYSPSLIQQEQFSQASSALNKFAHKVDRGMLLHPDFMNYSAYVQWFAKSLEVLSHIESFPEFDFNNDSIIYHYQPSEHEIKLIINLLGPECIEVENNNKAFSKKISVFGNNLWAAYLLQMTSICGLQLVSMNVPYYATFLGATNSQTTNLLMYFNLVQLFFSMFWLFLSDKIGRKLVYIIVIVWYIIVTYFMTFAPKLKQEASLAYVTALRAISGISAIIQPLGYTITADLAPPKIRGVVMIINNCFAQLGGVIASLVTLFISKSEKYTTEDVFVGTPEYDERVIKSFVHGLYISVGFFSFSLLATIFFLKESSVKLQAAKQLKKMGVTQSEKTQKEPFLSVLSSMVKDRDQILMFFAYILSIIGANNSKVGGSVFVQKAYGFGTINEAKGYANMIQTVGIVISITFSTLCTNIMLKSFGECRVIVLCEFVSMLEYIVNFAVNEPIPLFLGYITTCIISLALIYCDTIFIAMESETTTPENQGQKMGIFEIGNSIGRILSSLVTGQMLDYNIRDTQILTCTFSAVSLLLLAFLNPPIERTEMDVEDFKERNMKKMKATI